MFEFNVYDGYDDDIDVLKKKAMEYSKKRNFEKMNTVKKHAVFYHELYKPNLKSHIILIESESEKKENIPYDAWYKKNGEKTLGTAYFLTDEHRDFVNKTREDDLRPYVRSSSERFDVPADAEFVLYLEPDSYNILESTINNDSDDSEQTDDSDDSEQTDDSDDSNQHKLKKCRLNEHDKANPKESFYKIEKLGEELKKKSVIVPTERFKTWLNAGKSRRIKSRRIKSRRIKSRRIKSRSRQTRRR